MIDAAASCCPIISPAAPGLDKFISVAHPDFREELIRSAWEMHIRRRSNKR